MTKKTEAPIAEVTPVEIIRGRMPAAMIAVMRFHEEEGLSDSAMAKKYLTTPGKAADVRKGSNFGWVVEDTKFSQDDIDAALERAAKLEDADEISAKLNALPIGTEDDLKAEAEKRKATRKPRGKKTEEDKVEDSAAQGELDDLDDLLE
jgi:hypothetical protein